MAKQDVRYVAPIISYRYNEDSEQASGREIMTYVIIWLICGFGCAAIASSKNKSAFGWFFLGVLLGPLGILIIGFMKAEDEILKPNIQEHSDIDNLKQLGEIAALARIVNDNKNPNTAYKRKAARALAELGDVRGNKYLEATTSDLARKLPTKSINEEKSGTSFDDNQVTENGEGTEETKTLLKIEKLEMMGDADALAVLIAEETKEDICLTAAKALIKLGDKRGDRYLASVESKRIDATKQD